MARGCVRACVGGGVPVRAGAHSRRHAGRATRRSPGCARYTADRPRRCTRCQGSLQGRRPEPRGVPAAEARDQAGCARRRARHQEERLTTHPPAARRAARPASRGTRPHASSPAVGAGEVEAARRPDQHVQALQAWIPLGATLVADLTLVPGPGNRASCLFCALPCIIAGLSPPLWNSDRAALLLRDSDRPISAAVRLGLSCARRCLIRIEPFPSAVRLGSRHRLTETTRRGER